MASFNALGMPVKPLLYLNLTLNADKFSVTSFALGTHYLISTYQRNSTIMAVSVPSRLLAAFVLYRAGGNWVQVAVFEISMGIVTGAALLWDRGI